MKVLFARECDIKPFKAEIIISELRERARKLNFQPEIKVILTEKARHFAESNYSEIKGSFCIKDCEVLTDEGQDF